MYPFGINGLSFWMQNLFVPFKTRYLGSILSNSVDFCSRFDHI